MIRSHPCLVVLATVLLSGLIGHFPVVWFLRATGFYRPTAAGKPHFARWIGIFERFAITLFVLLDALVGAAFIFGLKTAVMSWRVDEHERKGEIVEYILMGTFVSFIVAVTFALVGRALLGFPLIKVQP